MGGQSRQAPSVGPQVPPSSLPRASSISGPLAAHVTPSLRGDSGESRSVGPPVGPTPRQGPTSTSGSLAAHIHCTPSVGPCFGCTPSLGACNTTPPLGTHATIPPLRPSNPTNSKDGGQPLVSPQSLQASNPRTQETIASHEDQNASDVQSTSQKPVLTLDGYG